MTVGASVRMVPRQWAVAGIAAAFLAYIVMVLAAAGDVPVLFTVLLMGVLGLELLGEREAPWLTPVLRGVQFGVSSRGLIATFAFGLLLDRHFEDWSTPELVAVMALLFGLPLSRSFCLLALFASRSLTNQPVLTRNIDLGALRSPMPELFTKALGSAPDRRLVFVGAVPLIVGAAGATADQIWPFLLTALIYVCALVAAGLFALFRWWQRRRLTSGWESKALDRIRALRPEVILYFSGSPESAYQINMWLAPLERLGRPTLVMLREKHVLENLAPTRLPVACLPNAVTVMSAKLTDARVALYPANTGKNIHLLREPGMRHVFIGHGDSDKVSSINPFSKVYDEVWVAGRAGRDRWANARVGVRDEDVVEVGRPQLEAVKRVTQRPRAGVPLTVLYAPTWEGWTDEDFSTSLTHMGPSLVRALLAAEHPVRVLYKPHPFTGHRDRRAARAHEQISSILERANGGGASISPVSTSDRSTALSLNEIESRLSVPGLDPDEAAHLSDEWSQSFWGHHSAHRHLVIDATRPTLFDCFNHTDVLIADVSSVVSDFLASGKPYVCANPRGLDEEVFRRENPSASAAYLLGPDCAEIAEILADVLGPDSLAAERTTLRNYLLGPDEPPPIERWRVALDTLASTATSAMPPTTIDADALDQPVDPTAGAEPTSQPETGRR